VARQEVVAAEAEMMVEAAGRMVGVEEVTQACRLMKRRQGTYRSILATMVASPPYVHRTL
jgi:hypothetical protein